MQENEVASLDQVIAELSNRTNTATYYNLVVDDGSFRGKEVIGKQLFQAEEARQAIERQVGLWPGKKLYISVFNPNGAYPKPKPSAIYLLDQYNYNKMADTSMYNNNTPQRNEREDFSKFTNDKMANYVLGEKTAEIDRLRDELRRERDRMIRLEDELKEKKDKISEQALELKSIEREWDFKLKQKETELAGNSTLSGIKEIAMANPDLVTNLGAMLMDRLLGAKAPAPLMGGMPSMPGKSAEANQLIEQINQILSGYDDLKLSQAYYVLLLANQNQVSLADILQPFNNQ